MKKSKGLTLGILSIIFLLILAACSDADSSTGESSSYPEGEVTIIVPFGSGGAADVTARLLAESAEEHLGTDIVIENREGGGGTAGQQAVASADADGYTLLLATNSVITNPMFSNVEYNVDDFTPVSQTVSDIFYLYIPADAEYDDIDSFVEYAKENPNELTIATSGAQTIGHFGAQSFMDAAEIEVNLVPYEGGGKVVSSVAGGHDSAGMLSFSEAEPQVESGNVKPILVFNDEPSDKYPDIPNTFDKGFDVVTDSWRGILAPSETDSEIISKLEEAFQKANEEEEYVESMENQGLDINYKDSEGLQELIDGIVEDYSNQQ